MSTAEQINALKAWTYTDADSIRKVHTMIERGIDRIGNQKQDFFASIGKGPDLNNNVFYWSEEYDYSPVITGALSSTTLTFSGYLFGSQAMSEAVMRQHIRVGTMLERPSDNLQLLVSAVDYDNVRCTVGAHGNTGSLSNDDSAIEYRIVGHATTDDNETHYPMALDLAWRKAGTQISEACFEYSHTWREIDMAKELEIKDKVQYQVTGIIRNLRTLMGTSILIGSPKYYGSDYVYGDSSQTSMVTGIFTWPRIVNDERAKTNTYIDMNASGTRQPVNPTALNDLIFHNREEEGADYSEGDWVIVCDPVTRQYISMFDDDCLVKNPSSTKSGTYITTFITRDGDSFPIMKDAWMRKGTLAVVNRKDCKWGYLKNSDYKIKDLPTQSMLEKKLIYVQYWVRVRRPRQIAYMYNMPLSK